MGADLTNNSIKKNNIIQSLNYWHNDSNLFNRAKMEAEPIIHANDYREETIRRVWENQKPVNED
jgi:hypothetical protein